MTRVRSLVRRPVARLCVASLLACGAAAVASAPAQGIVLDERVKAAMLYQFARFVEWPAPRSATGSSMPFVVVVVDADGIGRHLSQIAAAQAASGRRFVVKRLRGTEDLTGALDLLFIGAAGHGAVPALLRSIDGAAVLTVSDTRDFVQRGGIIALRENRERVAFDISLANARRANLRISSKLLSLANVVDGRIEVDR